MMLKSRPYPRLCATSTKSYLVTRLVDTDVHSTRYAEWPRAELWEGVGRVLLGLLGGATAESPLLTQLSFSRLYGK